MICCKFYFCSFDLCGRSKPREDDKSDQTSVSQRLRDNPAVCHLNSFRGGGSSRARRAKRRVGQVRQKDEKCEEEFIVDETYIVHQQDSAIVRLHICQFCFVFSQGVNFYQHYKCIADTPWLRTPVYSNITHVKPACTS